MFQLERVGVARGERVGSAGHPVRRVKVHQHQDSGPSRRGAPQPTPSAESPPSTA
jgi:hypothetical protein